MLSAWEITFSSKHLTRVAKTIIPWNSKDNWYTLGGMGWSSIHEPLSELCMGQNRSFMRLEYNLPHTKGWCLQSLIHCCIICFKNHLRNYSHTKYYLEILAFGSRGNISVEEKNRNLQLLKDEKHLQSLYWNWKAAAEMPVGGTQDEYSGDFPFWILGLSLCMIIWKVRLRE